MTDPSKETPAANREAAVYLVIFVVASLFNLWATRVGWESRNLPGVEFRQAQTAISAYFIQQDHDFSLAYPTPVLGKPWSIPMEFPLYQWTVVGLSNLTGLDLTKAGRVVSQGCFYLCLPAVFLLLGRIGVEKRRRWLVLALVVTCPFYIFYSRSFLMETMALMFGLWFWVSFERSVENRHWRWLLVAMLAGTGAGLVKVTTFMLYLLPTGCWALRRLWSGRNDRRWRGDLVWMALAVALPFAATLWWLRFADATKALNASAQFIREQNVGDFTWGTWAAHFSPELWRQKWNIITEQLSRWPLLVGGFLLLALTGGRRMAEAFRLLLWFGAVLVIFPVLYARHEYYFIANALLLLLAVGLGLVALAESGRPVWLVVLATLVFTGGHVARYLDGYYQAQVGISDGGDGLSHSLRGLTEPDEVLLITGQDWNSMTPYYAQRRALMIRENAEQNTAQLDAAFAALKGEKIGALVLGPETRDREKLIQRAVALGIDPQPLFRWQGVAVHLPLARRNASVQSIIDVGYDGLIFEKGVELPPNRLANRWYETAGLGPYQRRIFSTMRPEPVRFFSTYGPNLDGSTGVPSFGAHPVTRLVFRLAAGAHTLMTTATISPDAYAETLPEEERTDGVEITLARLGPGPDPEREELFTRLLDPRDRSEDRGPQPIRVSFTLERESEVELFIGPGPQDSIVRDWISLGPVVIR